MAHAPLITAAELPAFGCPLDFLSQFAVRPFRVRIAAGGVLGSMAVEWQGVGEEDWSSAEVSSSVAPWSWSPLPTAVVAFAAGTYVGESEYLVDTAGGVTRTTGGLDAVTATRYDLVGNAIAAATNEAVTRMRPRKQPAILSWGADVKRHAAALVKYLLKDGVGFAPMENNSGDFQIKDAAREAREYFDRIGDQGLDPWDMVDSSASGKGNNLLQSIASDDPTWY